MRLDDETGFGTGILVCGGEMRELLGGSSLTLVVV